MVVVWWWFGGGLVVVWWWFGGGLVVGKNYSKFGVQRQRAAVTYEGMGRDVP